MFSMSRRELEFSMEKTERFSMELEVPLDWFPLLEVPADLDMFMRDLPETEVPADFLEPAELEVPTDMFSRDPL